MSNNQSNLEVSHALTRAEIRNNIDSPTTSINSLQNFSNSLNGLERIIEETKIDDSEIEEEILLTTGFPPIQTNFMNVNQSNSNTPNTPFPSNTNSNSYYLYNNSPTGFNQYNHFSNILNHVNTFVRVVSPGLFNSQIPNFMNTRQASPTFEDPTRIFSSPINIISDLSRLSPSTIFYAGEDPGFLENSM